MLDPTARKFLRAAVQRFRAAEKLLELEFNLEAIYLAGYTVECAMKAMLLDRTPPKRHPQLLEQVFRGQRGHNLSGLRLLLRHRGVVLPAAVASMLLRVQTWSTDLRYQVGLVETDEAEAFLDAAAQILRWIQRSVS